MTDIQYDDEINLALGVTDLERSVAFFEERLGFPKLFLDAKHRWATLGTFVPGVTLGLSEVETAAGRGGATPTFGVRDLDAVRRRLESAEVAFDGDTIEIPGVTKFATFFDPDGNAFMLAQKLR